MVKQDHTEIPNPGKWKDDSEKEEETGDCEKENMDIYWTAA